MNGTRDIISTPPARAVRAWPELTIAAAWPIAVRLDTQ
jgi:hypothetical protein